MEPVGRISTQKVLAILVAAGIVLYLIRPILLPFVLAAAIAYALDPAVECLSAQTSSRRWASATLIFTGISIVLTVAGLFTLPSLISQLLELLGDMQSVVEHAIAGDMIERVGLAHPAANRGVYLFPRLVVRRNHERAFRPFEIRIGDRSVTVAGICIFMDTLLRGQQPERFFGAAVPECEHHLFQLGVLLPHYLF